MSHLSEDVKFSLKVMVNKQKTKVHFAEADSKFAEAMLCYLTMPLGEIVRVMKRRYGEKEPMVGSLNSLYMGLSNLDEYCFWTDAGTKMLLNPRNSFFSQPVKYFRCKSKEYNRTGPPNVSIYYSSARCDCGEPLSKAMSEIKPTSPAAGDGILAQGLSFLVTDDLQMAPYEPGSLIQTFVDLGIVLSEGAELLDVTLGYNEIVDLLKGALLSKTPLTDTILRASSNTSCASLGMMEPNLVPEPSSTSSKKMTVTAVVQKSTNKLLYVESDEDFADFILSLLTIPSGRVVSLLGGKTSLKGIDNVYNSAAKLINDKHFLTKHTKRKLLEPELPCYYVSKYQIFDLPEQATPPIYYYRSIDSLDRIVEIGSWMRYKDPKGNKGGYVKQPQEFTISDDLAVKPSHMGPNFRTLGIPWCDTERVKLHIGLKEGLNILKASLASSSALTNGLTIPF